MRSLLFSAVLSIVLCHSDGLVRPPTTSSHRTWRSPMRHHPPRSVVAHASPKTVTLSGQPWRLQLSVQLPQANGQITTKQLSMEARFELDEGYEPPQGRLVSISTEDGGKYLDSDASNRWTLSEDPDDRRDGLWIWGLFNEPLYPFCLLQFTLKGVPTGNSRGDGEDGGETGECFPPFTAYCQIKHTADRKTGEVSKVQSLRNGTLPVGRKLALLMERYFGCKIVPQVTLAPTEVTARTVERIAVDLAGLATADISTNQAAGSVRFTPLL